MKPTMPMGCTTAPVCLLVLLVGTLAVVGLLVGARITHSAPAAQGTATNAVEFPATPPR